MEAKCCWNNAKLSGVNNACFVISRFPLDLSHKMEVDRISTYPQRALAGEYMHEKCRRWPGNEQK